MAAFVAIHGGFDGGWAWADIAHVLRKAGHQVFTPTLTGSGERVHLRSPDICLATLVTDIVNVIRYENLLDVIVVGHSLGGVVATGVVQEVPERIRHVVYLDALVPVNDESVFDMFGAELSSWIERTAGEQGDGWRLPHSPASADRRTDVLLRPLRDRSKVKHSNFDCTYVAFTAKAKDDPFAPVLNRMADRMRAEKRCRFIEVGLPHFPLLEHADEVANVLLQSLPAYPDPEARL